MKKQFFILATIFTAVVFSSCSKDGFESKQFGPAEEIATAKKPGGGGNGSLNLNKGLDGWYKFDGNLQEATGKLANGVPTTSGADIYTDDRNGNPEKALKLNGRYGVNVFGVPLEINSTVATWAKFDSVTSITNYFVTTHWPNPQFAQENKSYFGVISTPITSGVPSISDDHWHHLVATYDGTDLKFYVDGIYIGSTLNPALGTYIPGATCDYKIGFNTPQNSKDFTSVWYGSVDDLRFYTRVLSASEVQALFNL